MSSKLIIIFALVFLILTLLSGVIENTYLPANALSLFDMVKQFDIGKLNPFSENNVYDMLFKMLTWDYAFLQGEYIIFRYLGMCLSLGIFYPFILYILSIFGGLFSKLFRIGA